MVLHPLVCLFSVSPLPPLSVVLSCSFVQFRAQFCRASTHNRRLQLCVSHAGNRARGDYGCICSPQVYTKVHPPHGLLGLDALQPVVAQPLQPLGRPGFREAADAYDYEEDPTPKMPIPTKVYSYDRLARLHRLWGGNTTAAVSSWRS